MSSTPTREELHDAVRAIVHEHGLPNGRNARANTIAARLSERFFGSAFTADEVAICATLDAITRLVETRVTHTLSVLGGPRCAPGDKLSDLVYSLPVIAFQDAGRVVALFDATTDQGVLEAFSYAARNTHTFVRFGGDSQLGTSYALQDGLPRWRRSAAACVAACRPKWAA